MKHLIIELPLKPTYDKPCRMFYKYYFSNGDALLPMLITLALINGTYTSHADCIRVHLNYPDLISLRHYFLLPPAFSSASRGKCLALASLLIFTY